MKRPASAHGRRLAPAALLLLLAVRLVVAAGADSSVGDEHPHILSGWLYLTSGRFSGGFDNPPLGQLWVAAPLVLFGRPYRFPSDEHLMWSRVPVMLLGLGLAWLLWRWGRRLGGDAAGLATLAGVCIEPNLIAHAHLATLDLPLTLAWWAALWWARESLEHAVQPAPGRRAWRAALLFALAAAAATLVKFTGLLLYPSAALVAVLVLRRARPARRAAVGLVAGLAVLWLAALSAYGFEPLHAGLPEHLRAGLEGKLAHRAEVTYAYLAGRRSPNGFLAYYPVALLVKTPLPLLALALFGAVTLWRQARRELAFLVLPALVVVVAFTLARVHIGVRHVLPVYPALLLLAGAGAAGLGRRGPAARLGLAVLGLMWIGGVARLGSESLTYFNVLAGGRAGGHRWLLDSNLDWGQDDRRLERWLARAAQRGETWAVNPPLDGARPGRLAVSANALHHLQRRSRGPYAWLVDLEPRALAGGSWRLYDLQAADFERRAAVRPDDAAAQLAHAEVLESSGETARAAAQFAALARRFADDPEVARREVRFALRQGDALRAQAAAERGLGILPGDAELRRLQERARLEVRLVRATARGPAAEAAAALALGLWRAESGELEAAWPLLDRAARLDPASLEAQRARAVGLAHRGEFAAAADLLARLGPGLEAELRACRALADTEAGLDSTRLPLPGVEALLELGRTHFDDGRFDRAARALVGALRQDPQHGLALAYLGEMQVRSKLGIVAERLAPRSLAPVE